MATSNPAFSQSPAFQNKAAATTLSADKLQELYESPSATSLDTDRMSVEDTIVKTAVSFAVLVAGAVIGWIVPVLWVPAMIVGLVLAFVNIFRNRKKLPSAGLTLAYAGVEGIFIGGISALFESLWSGVVIQAVIGTMVVVGVTLALFASGKIRASAKATKVFFIAMIGYLLFSVINILLIVTGANSDPWGLRGSVHVMGIPLGLIIGVLVVIMCAYSLVLDFDMIQQGVKNRAPRAYGWAGAFGIMVTVVWLYLELLRIFAISRN
jgi:uncharacterized YccA/Bax inhibitor family protein